MKAYLTYTILSLSLILSTEILHCQPQSMNNNKLTISQYILPGPNFYQYQLNNESIKVLEVRWKWYRGQSNLKRKVIYKKKLNKDNIDSIDSIIIQLDLNNIDTSYSKPVIDGVIWVYEFNWNQMTKKIRLDNFYLERLNPLLCYMNGLLPLKKRIISFDIFETKPKNNNR